MSFKDDYGYEYDYTGGYITEYKEVCDKCGKTYTVITQKDDNPEYHTPVFVKCDCGGVVYFNLPVN